MLWVGDKLKLMKLLVAIGLIASAPGCATIIRGTDQEVAVNTNPVGATVQFSNGQTCTSPCKIKAARNQSIMLNISKPGCHPQTSTMMPVLAGGGVLLGGLIDYGTGAVYDLQPNPLTVTLVCGAEGMTPPPMPVPAAPATVDCMSEGGVRVRLVGTVCPDKFTPAS